MPDQGPRQLAVPPGTIPVPVNEVFTVANEYVEAGRLDAAERMLHHILATAPMQPEALQLQGLIAFKRGDRAQAVQLMERSLVGGANKATHWRNLSEVYRLEARLDEALAAGRRAVSLDPADPIGPFNLAMVLYDRLEIDACVAAARHAIDLRAGLPQAHMKLAQALLLRGDLAEGWAEYEWRYQIPGAQPLMPAGLNVNPPRPQWDGAPTQGKLLLIADQGYGDVVQFSRYLPWVLERASNIAIAVSGEMTGLLQAMAPKARLFTRWEECGAFDAFCPLSGLPRLHGTTLADVPWSGPYLHADPGLAARWRDRLDGMVPPGLRRVGLAWAGRPTHNNDVNRTAGLAALAPLGEVPGVAFVSVQKGPAARQAEQWAGPAPLVDLDALITSFDDTMAILSTLDLLVCVDTSVGHFAGALGVPAWVMLPRAPDWRWLLDRADTPWYPSVRLFRNPSPRRWDLLVPQVADALRARFAH